MPSIPSPPGAAGPARVLVFAGSSIETGRVKRAGGAPERDLVTQLLLGVGCGRLYRAETVAEAIEVACHEPIDLIATETGLDGKGFALLRAVRHHPDPALRRLPVLVVCTSASRTEVERARDGGANAVVRPPISTQMLAGRIAWLREASRPFVVSPTYVGPDRRVGGDLPPGLLCRRAPSPSVAEADGGNLTQEAMDALFFAAG